MFICLTVSLFLLVYILQTHSYILSIGYKNIILYEKRYLTLRSQFLLELSNVFQVLFQGLYIVCQP